MNVMPAINNDLEPPAEFEHCGALGLMINWRALVS